MKKFLMFMMAAGVIFSFTGIARAGAWILWEGNFEWSDDQGLHMVWKTMDAFQTFKQCKEAQMNLCRERIARIPWSKKTGKSWTVIDRCPDTSGFGESGVSNYKCLPESTEPR